MGRKRRREEKKKIIEQRKLTRNGIRKKKYSQMSSQGVLGQQEISKYEEIRAILMEINGSYGNLLCPAYDNLGKPQIFRHDYDSAKRYLSRLEVQSQF